MVSNARAPRAFLQACLSISGGGAVISEQRSYYYNIMAFLSLTGGITYFSSSLFSWSDGFVLISEIRQIYKPSCCIKIAGGIIHFNCNSRFFNLSTVSGMQLSFSR